MKVFLLVLYNERELGPLVMCDETNKSRHIQQLRGMSSKHCHIIIITRNSLGAKYLQI